MKRAGLWFTALLAMVGGVGCQKQVELVFYNQNAKPVDVIVSAPDPHGSRYVGTVGPQETLRYPLSIAQDQLPAMCSWRIEGGRPMPLEITEQTRSPQYLSIDDVFGHRGPWTEPPAEVD
jgi:hypothetical protein